MKTLDDVRQAISKVGRFSSDKPVLEDTENTVPHTRFSIFTDNNEYRIMGREDGSTYLGCIALSRKPRAGEDWRRGNDLADGKLNLDTWHRILEDIVSYELVPVCKDGRKSSIPVSSE